MSVLSAAHFHDEAKAFEYLERIIWADGVTCPHCGVVGGKVYDLAGVRGKPSVKSPQGAIRFGLKKCGDCRKQFTVKVGTVFEHARMPLHKMLQAVHLMMSSKKGISAHQLSRVLEVQYKTAWFLAHRIREALRSGELAVPFGTGGTTVEADETFIGNIKGAEKRKAFHHKMKVLALVDRQTGTARSYVINEVSVTAIGPILAANISREAKLMTDEAMVYRKLGKDFASHASVNHVGGEYVDAWKPENHTNTVEGFFSIYKRGMKGIYQHCGEQHLHRYLAEFDFRYSNRAKLGVDDKTRAVNAVKGIVGKRLTYRRIDGLSQA